MQSTSSIDFIQVSKGEPTIIQCYNFIQLILVHCLPYVFIFDKQRRDSPQVQAKIEAPLWVQVPAQCPVWAFVRAVCSSPTVTTVEDWHSAGWKWPGARSSGKTPTPWLSARSRERALREITRTCSHNSEQAVTQPRIKGFSFIALFATAQPMPVTSWRKRRD